MQRGDEILARWDGKALRAVGGRDRDAIAEFPADTVFSLRKWEPGTQGARAFISVFLKVFADAHPDPAMTDQKLKTSLKATHHWIDGVVFDEAGGEAKFKSVGKMSREELALFTEQAKDFAADLGLDVDALEAETAVRLKPRRAR
ncbi:hypothetical protein [Bosea sp. ASV33]|uniref:hypothetical protein n=1 Tax=Bosea sp. ASV33 TaxID=2795106 RepID=UPI0018ECE2E4|nr:hypothetical protein [Bosea sp. ASV33]